MMQNLLKEKQEIQVTPEWQKFFSIYQFLKSIFLSYANLSQRIFKINKDLFLLFSENQGYT